MLRCVQFFILETNSSDLLTGATQIVASTLRQWCRIYLVIGPGTNGGPFSVTRRAGNATIWVAPLLTAYNVAANPLWEIVEEAANAALQSANGSNSKFQPLEALLARSPDTPATSGRYRNPYFIAGP